MKDQLDPRTLLALVAMISTIAVFTKHLRIHGFVLIILVVMILVFKVPIKKFLFRIKKMFPILIFVILAQSLFTQGTPLLSIASMSILSVEGVMLGVNTMLRISILILSASLFTLTSETKMIQGLRQLKMPDEIALMTLIALRFLPAYVQEFQDAFLAIALRGIDMKELSLKQKTKLIQYLFAPTMVRTLLKAKRLSMALDLKGFRALNVRSSLSVCKFHRIDYLIIMCSSFVLILWIWIEWRI